MISKNLMSSKDVRDLAYDKLSQSPSIDHAIYKPLDNNLPYIHLDEGLVVNTNYVGTTNTYNSMQWGYGLTALADNTLRLPYIEKWANPDPDRGSWWDECKKAAWDIYNRWGKVIVLMSGGIDSKLAALAFLEAGVPFEAYTLLYKAFAKKADRIINEHDVKHAIEFTQKFGITHHFTTIDICQMISDREHLEFIIPERQESINIIANSFTRAFAVKEINEKYQAVAVGGGTAMPISLSESGQLIITISDCACLGHPLVWIEHNGYASQLDFFSYTPNQIAAYLDIPEVQNTDVVNYKFKQDIGMKYGSDQLDKVEYKLYNQVTNKYTGFEHVRQIFAFHNIDYHKEYSMELFNMVDWTTRPKMKYAIVASAVPKTSTFDNMILDPIHFDTGSW
jgi:hypothetical protein